MTTIREEVSFKLENSPHIVRESIINSLVDAEINLRSEKALGVFNQIEDQTKVVKRLLKPDVEVFDENGNIVSVSFSKERSGELKKAREKLTKLEEALSKAFDKNDWSGVLTLG